MTVNISSIQQLLAESKFVEAQKEVELILNEPRSSESIELIELYFECLKAQSRPLPTALLLSFIEKLIETDPARAQSWLELILKPSSRDQQRLLLCKIKIAELRGHTENLYQFILDFQVARFESRNPQLPIVVWEFADKYFPSDFQIHLQRLAIDLLRMDLTSSERLLKNLILSCFEKSSPKGTKEKINALYEVLKSADSLHHLEVYKNLCLFISQGLTEKKDIKRLNELIIFIDDFKFQTLLLNILFEHGHLEACKAYAQEIRLNDKYDYVYFDKYFSHLKSFFFKKIKQLEQAKLPDVFETDFTTGKSPVPPMDELKAEVAEEEVLLSHLLKHQNFSTSEMLDVAVSFVQSEFYYAGLKASQLAFDSTIDNSLRLKASYLKVTCLLKTGDYRSALDVSLDALSISQTQNDVLSFMYSQAEAHLRMKQYPSAKLILLKILTIDSQYRLTKERLDRLNAI